MIVFIRWNFTFSFVLVARFNDGCKAVTLAAELAVTAASHKQKVQKETMVILRKKASNF